MLCSTTLSFKRRALRVSLACSLLVQRTGYSNDFAGVKERALDCASSRGHAEILLEIGNDIFRVCLPFSPSRGMTLSQG